MDNSTVRAAGSRDSSDRDEVAAIHWVHPRLTRPTPLIESRLCIGRGGNCDIQFTDGSVSRRHLEIYRQGPIFAIRDLDSTNGTHVNGQRVQHGAIARGDVIRLGDHVGVVGSVPARADYVEFSELAPGLFGGGSLSKQLDIVRRVARSGLPIVLIGETGVGKERVAHAIHAWSGKTGLFCAVNCASLPPDLAEPGLFGALNATDEAAHLGYFRQAHGGTLLLDEVGELPLAVQAKLLRVLEEGIVVPPGQARGLKVDVAIIATSQRDLSEMVEKGEFRNDIYARLSGATVALASLRERREDIAPSFAHFLAQYAEGDPPPCDAALVEALSLYSWPRNVRELELLARQMLALHADAPILCHSLLPEAIRGERVGSMPAPAAIPTADRRQHDLRLLVGALKRTGGNVKAAAEALGFSRQRAYRLINGRSVSELMALELQEQPSSSGATSGGSS